MVRRIALGSLASCGLAILAAAFQQDPWAEEKKDPDFADVDWGFKDNTPAELLTAMAPLGAPLYDRFCVHCHGEKGDGKGDLAPMLIPPPRDFTKGVFKGRSSHPKLPPTATDLMRSLVHGIPLSAMLSYSFIDTDMQMMLIGHVKSLAVDTSVVPPLDHFARGFGFPLKSGNFHRDAGMPFPTAEAVARGRALFDRLNCVACHGEKGDGKGRVSETLSDTNVVEGGFEFERPSNVRNLTQGIYSGGPNVRHMYLRVSGGVQGTVMPPFATSASVGDRWALAHYVMALSLRAKELPLPHSEMMIVQKAAALPTLPGDPAWSALEKLPAPPKEPGPFGYPIQPVYVLHPFFQQTRHNPARPYFIEATARALHDGKSIALRLEWEDAASDPGDRIEVQLSPSKQPAFAIYGSAADPVNVWRWEGKAPMAAAEFDGTGPFALAPQAGPSNVTANGAYDPATKRWAVVLTRSLTGGGGADAPITVGETKEDLNPFLVLMKDGSEAWPQGTRAVKEDPDDPAENANARIREAARVAAENAIEAKFADLPRHLTTWHFMRLKP
ncbi:MAG TPA: c-type cytochrome [Planctomycetota bacterium]|nr:c-type cytochrome [Planctomycetota bacterium]